MSSLMSQSASYDATNAWVILLITKDIASLVWVEASIVALAVLTFVIFRVHKPNTNIGPNQGSKVSKTVTEEDVDSQKEGITSELVARQDFLCESWHSIQIFCLSLRDLAARYFQDHVQVVAELCLATFSSQHLVRLSRDWACWSCSYGAWDSLASRLFSSLADIDDEREGDCTTTSSINAEDDAEPRIDVDAWRSVGARICSRIADIDIEEEPDFSSEKIDVNAWRSVGARISASIADMAFEDDASDFLMPS